MGVRLTSRERRLAEAGELRHVYRVRCVVCGAMNTGRRPREGVLPGDGTLMYPRRHAGADGAPCPGNARHAIDVVMDPGTLAVVEEVPPDC